MQDISRVLLGFRVLIATMTGLIKGDARSSACCSCGGTAREKGS